MAQIVFSRVGASIGNAVLPQGLNFLGRSLGGAAIGRALGGYIGRAVDTALAGATEGPRVPSLHIMESREGAGISNAYGRMRVGGQVFWASNFREWRDTERVGGKGGPEVTEFRYSVSVAIALGEGEIHRIGQVWANNEPFDMSGVSYRLYSGAEDQTIDPYIEMLEGDAPAYRGLAYIVFEDLPLDEFGNRLPQFSFEVFRRPKENDTSLAGHVTGVNIIPASGEFVYATEIVREQEFPGVERALNANTGQARSDFLVSLDQLEADLPNVERVALTVGWFGDSVLAGDCKIRPGVETRIRTTIPSDWSVAGESRAGAYLISQVDGNPNYGGTPSDGTVVQAIQELNNRGIDVTVTPFLFLDADGFPWRGRITVAQDGTASARSKIEAFVGDADDFGYRHFILHHARLCAEAGGVEAFLIGSEMRGLTRVRDEFGRFPFVEALIDLAAEIRALLPDAKISYAADWTEYGAYVPGDGSNDVLFPLDTLWADSNIDFVGIDWYPRWETGATGISIWMRWPDMSQVMIPDILRANWKVERPMITSMPRLKIAPHKFVRRLLIQRMESTGSFERKT